MKKSEIKFIVTLDKENIPEKIEWLLRIVLVIVYPKQNL